MKKKLPESEKYLITFRWKNKDWYRLSGPAKDFIKENLEFDIAERYGDNGGDSIKYKIRRVK